MKTSIGFSIITLFFLYFSFVTPAVAQEYSDEEICGFTEEEQEVIENMEQKGGLGITSIGTVRALMLFIDFSDDDEDPNNPNWPVGDGPAYLDSIIHPDEGYPVRQNNITSFLADNSFDQFIMVGEAIYSQALRSLSDYQNDPNTSSNVAKWATWDVLDSLDDVMDFAPYDNWKRIANYQHEEQPDSVIDMIFVIFRRWYSANGFNYLGWASMPGSGKLYVDEGERWIDFGLSGVTSLAGIPQYKAFQVCLHEFGHKWGLPHSYNDGVWTIMSYWQHTPSPFMNSYERERLGWITYVDITTNTTIPDYGISGVPFRMQINANEYFLIENHQQYSPFDVINLYDPALNPFDAPGLYILRLNNSLASQKVKVVCADGNWNWENPYWILNPFGSGQPGDSIPVYNRLDPNPVYGLSDKNRIPHTKNGTERIVAWLDEVTGVEKHAARYKGLGLSRWIPDGSNVFSPWSNPPTTAANGTATTLGIEVTGYNPATGHITAYFYTQNPENASPSRILDLTLTAVEQHPSLRWSGSLEPDLDKYYIYRKIDDGNWQNLAQIEDTTFIDYEIVIPIGEPSQVFEASYYVKVKDTQSKFSTPSNTVSTAALWVDEGFGRYSAGDDPNLLPERIELEQNFPNPFNPETTIRFTLPEKSKVVLTVYSITGEYVATLVNGEMAEGYHQVSFDASRLASGIYLYRIQAGNFNQVRKMMLLK